MGVVTNITMTTAKEAGGSEESEDIVEVGSMVIESLLVMDFEHLGSQTLSQDQNQIPFKVC